MASNAADLGFEGNVRSNAVIELDEGLFRLWNSGVGIRVAMNAVNRNGGQASFEDVRRAYARIAERFANNPNG